MAFWLLPNERGEPMLKPMYLLNFPGPYLLWPVS